MKTGTAAKWKVLTLLNASLLSYTAGHTEGENDIVTQHTASYSEWLEGPCPSKSLVRLTFLPQHSIYRARDAFHTVHSNSLSPRQSTFHCLLSELIERT